MTTYTIYAPGRWHGDIHPAMEDREHEMQGGALSPAAVEVVQQYRDNTRTVKRGGGTIHRFDLTSIESVKFLRGEAAYRAEFWDGPPEWFGYEKDYAAKKAAETLVARCDEILKEVQS